MFFLPSMFCCALDSARTQSQICFLATTSAEGTLWRRPHLRGSVLHRLTHAHPAAIAFGAVGVAISAHPRSIVVPAVIVIAPIIVPLIGMLHAAVASNQAAVSVAASIRPVLDSAIPTNLAMI